MTIPQKFKIANNWVTVELVDKLDSNNYGMYNDAKQIITIAKSVIIDNEVVELTKEQLLNTFWHEYCHAMQFYFDNSTSEAQAQSYSNFICELFDTRIGQLELE